MNDLMKNNKALYKNQMNKILCKKMIFLYNRSHINEFIVQSSFIQIIDKVSFK